MSSRTHRSRRKNKAPQSPQQSRKVEAHLSPKRSGEGCLAPPTSPSSRRGGGQPGNANALKHGLYSANHRPFDKKVLQQVPVADLQDEIGLTRSYLHRYLASVDFTSPDSEVRRNALLTINFTVAQIAAMVRLQVRARQHALSSREIDEWLDSLP